MSKKYNTFNSFTWAFLDRGGLLFFQFFALVYLSRLVSPYDFGLIAILNVFIGVSNVVIDSGMAGALIKKKEVKAIDYYTLFVYNFILAILIYIIFYFGAPFIAFFYETPIMKDLIRVLSLSILINSFGLVQMVKLTRALNFKAQAIITISSQFLAVTISIYLAKNSYGVWALVALQLLHLVFSTLFLSFANRFLPKIKFSIGSFKEQFKFGGPLLLSNILFIINNNIYSSVIGKAFTATDSGYFFQSQKLQNTPTGILSAVVDKVAFTMFSKESKNENIISMATNMYKILYILVISAFVYVYYISEELFLFVFDENWVPAAKIFKILCLSIIPLTIKLLSRNLLKSTGETKTILKLETFNTISSILILMVTVFYTVEIIAYGIFINNVIICIFSMFYVELKLKYKFLEQLSLIVRPLILSVLTLLFLVFIFDSINISNLVLRQVIQIIVFFTIMVFFNKGLIMNLRTK